MNGRETGTGERLGVKGVMKHCRQPRECWQETKQRFLRAKTLHSHSRSHDRQWSPAHCRTHLESLARWPSISRNRWTKAGRLAVYSGQAANSVVYAVHFVRYSAFVEKRAVDYGGYPCRTPSSVARFQSVSVETSL